MIRITSMVLLALFLFPVACKNRKDIITKKTGDERTVVIEGKITGGSMNRILLEEMAAREFIPVDTIECDEEGNFRSSFTPDHSAFYVLRLYETGHLTLLIEPGEKIAFRGSTERSKPYSVKGSPGSELLQLLSTEHKKALAELRAIAREKARGQAEADFAAKNQVLDQRFDSITESFKTFSMQFIRDNKESLAAIIALYNLYGQGLPVFHPGDDLEVYLYVDSAFSVYHPESEFAQLLHAQVSEVMAIRDKTEKGAGPSTGDIAPDFVSSRPDGSELTLGEFRGRYVLLSFWAAWSKGSRDENLFLLEAWKNYREKSFTILQVSFDGEKAQWTAAIAEDGLGWEQVSDLKSWNSPLADLYQVERIPANFLIDPEGRIIARDLFGKELEQRLAQLL